MSTSKSRVLAGGLTTGIAALVATAGVALAAKPKPSSIFTTTGTASPSVYFKTSNTGKKLRMFQAGLAIRCNSSLCGGFGGVSGLTLNSIKVSKHGTFKVTGDILSAGAPGHQKKLGTETVTGKFVSATKVTGKVTSNITLGSGPSGYHGVTKSYTAKGVPSTG